VAITEAVDQRLLSHSVRELSPAVHTSYSTTNGPAICSNCLSVRGTHESYAVHICIPHQCMPLQPGIHFWSPEATPPALKYNPLQGRPLTAIFRRNERNFKNVWRPVLPFASAWEHQLGNAASTSAIGMNLKNRSHGVIATRARSLP
jgi:hypothetical protein